MTRIAGAPTAKPPPAPKPAPRVRSSPKPQYVPVVAPKAAPAPKPRYVPTSTSSGNNPRGVTHAVSKPTVNDKRVATVDTGNNPRGVAIQHPKLGGVTLASQRKTAVVNAEQHYLATHPAPSSSGGILGLGAISPASIVHVVTHIPSDITHGVEDAVKVPIIHNALTDVRDLVPNTLEGIAAVAQAGGNDLMHIASGATHLGPGASVPEAHYHSQLATLAKQSWQQSFIHDAVTGNVKGALHKLIQHPLYGALNAVGILDGAAEILGSVARSGASGGRLAAVAKLARDDRPLIDNSPGIPRHGSTNVIVRAAQRAGDKTHLPEPIEKAVVTHYLKRTVNEADRIAKGITGHNAHEIISEHHDAAVGEKSAIQKHLPGGHHIPAERKVAADAASLQVMGAVDRTHAIEDLQNLHDSIREHLDNTKMTKTDRKTAETNLANIKKVLDHPDLKAINEISQAILKRGAKQQDEMVELGLLSKAQAETAPLHAAVVMKHVPGDDIRIAAPDAKLPSVRKAMYTEAKKDVTTAKNDLAEAKRDAAKLPAAERPKYLENAKANLKDAQEHVVALKKYKNEYISGVVENTHIRVRGKDENGNPRYAVRRVPVDEIRRRLVAVGRHPDEMGYFNMSKPVGPDEIKASSRLRTLSRPDKAIRSRSASGIPKGHFRPGTAGMLDSQLQTQRAIDKARAFDFLDKQLSIRGDDGKLVDVNKDNAEAVKAHYEELTGHKLSIIPRHAAGAVNRLDEFVSGEGDLKMAKTKKSDRFGLMPTAAVDHYIKHGEVDRSPVVRKFGAINRAFRTTVLGLNPRWIVGNDVEGLLRSGLEGASPHDAMLVGKVKKVLADRGEHEANDVIDAIQGGQQYARAARKQHEALVEGSLTHPDRPTLLRNRPGIKQIVDLYQNRIVGPVFHMNSQIEHGFDKMVLGQFMHDQAKQFGANMYQAALHQEQYIDKLADGFTDPALAMQAGRYMQKTLGQYSGFGPRGKFLVNTLFPFAPWYTSALRFIYVTMPKDHAITQSVLLAAQQTVASEFSKQAQEQGSLNDKTFGHRFGELATDMPVSGGGLVNIGRYLPWGAVSGGPIGAVTSATGPQFQGPALAIAAGEDPFGSPLKDKNGDITDKGQQTIVGLNELFLSLAGPLDLYDRVVRDQGKTAYSGDTIFNQATKPGTDHGAPGVEGGLEKSLIPFYPTYLSSADAGSPGGVFGSSPSTNKVFSGGSTNKVFSGATSNNPVFK